MTWHSRVHEITPRDCTTPLCGKLGGKTRAGRARLKVTCKRCLKIIARRIEARRTQRQQKRAALRVSPLPLCPQSPSTVSASCTTARRLPVPRPSR